MVDGEPMPQAGWDREDLSSLHRLLVLSMTMLDQTQPDEILRLVAWGVGAMSAYELEAACLIADGQLTAWAEAPPSAMVRAALSEVADGELALDDGAWHWVFRLATFAGDHGRLVVGGIREPPLDAFCLLGMLAQQAAAALANAEWRRRDGNQASELHARNLEASAMLSRLEKQTAVHARLSAVFTPGNEEQGVANALHELTSLPVAVEDQFGNLHAWAGPEQPIPYPKPNPRRRDELLRAAQVNKAPLRTGTRLVSVVRPRHGVLGVVSLIDPEQLAGQDEVFALEYASTLLGAELAHQRSITEVESRLRRDLVDDLVEGTAGDAAIARAAALGHDLEEVHQVVVVQDDGASELSMLAEAVRRVVGRLSVPELMSRRGQTLVLVAAGVDGARLHRAVARETGSSAIAIGVGGTSEQHTVLPRSYAQALRALRVRRQSLVPHGVTSYASLGVYRLLDSGSNRDEVEDFVDEWLGSLLDYDERADAELVTTLWHYLECAGNYDRTAAALMVHRNTLRYRLKRIRAISGHDLSDVDTKLNLHVAVRTWRVLKSPPPD